MEIENILKKPWNLSTAYRESRTGSSDNSISMAYRSYLAISLSVYNLDSKL